MKWYPGYKPQFELGFEMFKKLSRCTVCINGSILDSKTKALRDCTVCKGTGMVKRV